MVALLAWAAFWKYWKGPPPVASRSRVQTQLIQNATMAAR